MALTEFDTKLNAYFDREMSGEERAAFMEELRTNSQYRWDFKLYRKMFQIMEQMDVEVPEDLPTRIKAELARMRREAPPPAPALLGPVSPYALAAAAVFFLALFLGRGTRPELPAPLPTRVAEVPEVQPAPVAPRAPEAAITTPGPIRMIPEGRVEVMRRGSITWTLAHAGDRIAYEDKVRTGPAASVRLVYPDRAWLKVKGGSLVQVLDEAVRLFQGDAWIKVEKTGSRFEARTPNAVASVRGTMYSVHVHRQPLDHDAVMAIATEGTAEGVAANLPTGTSNAAVSAAHTQVSLANTLWTRLLSAFDTEVHVFESTVAVAPLDPETGKPGEEQLVHAGQGTAVEGRTLSKAWQLSSEHYQSWRLPVPAAVLARAEADTAPVGSATGEATTADTAAAGVGAGEVSDTTGPGSASAGRPTGGLLGFDGINKR